MSIVIKKVTRRREYYVPKLYFDQFNTLSPNRNPAAEFCESALFLAYKDGTLVGRVAAIVNRKACSWRVLMLPAQWR